MRSFRHIPQGWCDSEALLDLDFFWEDVVDSFEVDESIPGTLASTNSKYSALSDSVSFKEMRLGCPCVLLRRFHRKYAIWSLCANSIDAEAAVCNRAEPA